jgi:hypothetical protein
MLTIRVEPEEMHLFTKWCENNNLPVSHVGVNVDTRYFKYLKGTMHETLFDDPKAVNFSDPVMLAIWKKHDLMVCCNVVVTQKDTHYFITFRKDGKTELKSSINELRILL